MNIGDIVTDGQLVVALVIALAAGLVSFASPCVLPLVPGYLAYIGGLAGVETATGTTTGTVSGTATTASTTDSSPVQSQRRNPARNRVVLGVTLFVIGFTAVFVAFMVFASTVGIWLLQYQDIIIRVMGLVVIVMGLVFVGLFRPLQRTRKFPLSPKVGLVGAPLLGAGFAVGWTPCLGPTLIAITSLSLQTGSLGRGALLGIAYSLGLGIPFILVALGLSWVTASTAFLRRNVRTINVIGGAVLVAIGVLMVTGIWTTLMLSLQAVMNSYVIPL